MQCWSLCYNQKLYSFVIEMELEGTLVLLGIWEMHIWEKQIHLNSGNRSLGIIQDTAKYVQLHDTNLLLQEVYLLQKVTH